MTKIGSVTFTLIFNYSSIAINEKRQLCKLPCHVCLSLQTQRTRIQVRNGEVSQSVSWLCGVTKLYSWLVHRYDRFIIDGCARKNPCEIHGFPYHNHGSNTSNHSPEEEQCHFAVAHSSEDEEDHSGSTNNSTLVISTDDVRPSSYYLYNSVAVTDLRNPNFTVEFRHRAPDRLPLFQQKPQKPWVLFMGFLTQRKGSMCPWECQTILFRGLRNEERRIEELERGSRWLFVILQLDPIRIFCSCKPSLRWFLWRAIWFEAPLSWEYK